MAEMRELLAAIGRPDAGLVLDSWHWYTAHETAGDILALKGSEVIAVDLNDAPAGIPVDEQVDSRRDLPAATGVIDLAGFLGALLRIGYDGPVRAEPFREDLRKMGREEAVETTAKAMRKAFALIRVRPRASKRHPAVAPGRGSAYPLGMSPSIRRDWDNHEARCAEEHIRWLRSIGPEEALSFHESFHRFAELLEGDAEGKDRLERRRREEKVACRERIVTALKGLARVLHGRRDSKDTG